MRPSKIYPFSIPANGSIVLLVSGDFVKIKSSTGALTLTGDTFGSLQGLLAGQGVRDTNFNRLTLKDDTGSTNAGYLLVSDSTFIDDRISGEVLVIDSEKSRVIAGNVYSASPAIGAVNYANIQLWNPIGSSKNIIVNSLEFGLSGAGAVLVYPGSVQLTTDLTANRNANLKMLGTLGVAKSMAKDEVTPYAYVPGSIMGVGFAAGAPPYQYSGKSPLVVPPNSGLNLIAMSIGLTIFANMTFIEESVL